MPDRAGRAGRRRQGRRPTGLRGAGASDLRRHLHARLRLTGDEEDARDVVQEAYLRAYRGLKRFRGDAQFTTWLYRITANCAVDPLGKRRPAPPRRADRRRRRSPTPARHDPEAQADAARPAGPPDRAPWPSCPPGCGRSSCSATSTTCPTRRSPPSSGISESAAKVRLHRARRKLRERLFPLRGEARRTPMRCDDAGRGPGRQRPTAATVGSTDAARRHVERLPALPGRAGPVPPAAADPPPRCAPRCSSPRPACSTEILATSRRPASATPSGRSSAAAGSPTSAASRRPPAGAAAGRVLAALAAGAPRRPAAVAARPAESAGARRRRESAGLSCA